MVNRVEDSFDRYRDTNRELAKQNEELKLISSEWQAKFLLERSENHKLVVKLHQKDSEIRQCHAELRQYYKENKRLMMNNERYFAIVEFVTKLQQKQSIANTTTAETSRILALPKSNANEEEDIDDLELSSLSSTTVEAAALALRETEQSGDNHELEQEEEEEEAQQQNVISLGNITEEDDDLIDDSLMPPEVTSVPPLVEERILHTTSIFNCLGSTPVPPKKLSNEDHQPDETTTNSNQLLQQQSHLEQPSRDVETNASRHSGTNFESTSPIQNFLPRTKHANSNSMLQSTPIRVRIQATQAVINESIEKRLSDNQENVQSEKNLKKPIKRKRQPAPAKRAAAGRGGGGVGEDPVASSIDTSDSAPRYNLRKRTKA